MLCIRCGEKEERVKTRHLCLSCYGIVRNRGEVMLYPKEDVFAKKLSQKYGNGIIQDFLRVAVSPDLGLSDVADKYGFSRERARQIYLELFNEPYTNSKHNKSITRATRANHAKHDLALRPARYKGNILKGVSSEFIVEQICRSLGYSVVANNHGSTIDLIINGKNVEVKSSHQVTITIRGGCGFYRFHCRKKQRDCADFFILHIVPEGRFFIVSHTETLKEWVYVRPINARKKWRKKTIVGEIEKYANAWHLLNVSQTFWPVSRPHPSNWTTG